MAQLLAARKESRAQLKILETRRKALCKGGFDKDLSAATSTVARAITTLEVEIRQLERHEQDSIVKRPAEEQDAIIVEYIRGMGLDRKESFLSALAEMIEDERDAL